MTKSEIITKYADTIMETMVDRFREVLKAHGRTQYKIYVWEDGEMECLLGPQGDNSYLAPRSGENRDLVYVDTVSYTGFNPQEIDDEAPEAEVIDACVDEYENTLQDRLDVIISSADEY